MLFVAIQPGPWFVSQPDGMANQKTDIGETALQTRKKTVVANSLNHNPKLKRQVLMSDSVISEPSVTLNIIRSKGLIGVTEHKVLFIGQKTVDGSATAGALSQSIQANADIEAKFGERALLTQMLRAARRINDVTQFDAIPLDDDGSAVDATGVITFTGTATEDGNLTFEIASAENQTFSIDVLVGDTASDLATALDAAIVLDPKAPFTSGAVAGAVTVTAANGGTIANTFLLRTTGAVAGITTALTAWTGGTTDPALSTVFDPIEDERYQTIVWPGEYTLSELTDLLDPRFNATNKIMDGVGITTITDTLSNVKTAADTANSQSVALFGNKPVSISNEFEGSHMREINDVMSAEFAAARSLRLTDGANLANVVITPRGPLDQFGGLSLATLPYFNTPFPDLPVPIVDTFWSTTERADLEDSGASVIGPNRARNGVIAAEIFTTNTTDPAANPDDSFKFLNTVDASSIGREFQFLNIKRAYVQSRLTDGDLVDGFSIENEDSVRAFVLSLYNALALVVVYQKGQKALTKFIESLVVSVTLTPGSGLVTLTEAPPLVGQLRDVQGTIQVSFGTEA